MRTRYYALSLLICVLTACGSSPAGAPVQVLTEDLAPAPQAAARKELAPAIQAPATEESISRVSVSADLGVPACPNTETHDSAVFAEEVLHLVNAQRTMSQLQPLTTNGPLTSAAQTHAMDTACKLFISHTGSDGSSPFDRMLRFGYSYSIAGENVAAGYPTPSDVVEGWMGSSGHRANIMNPSFTEAGIGYVYSSASTSENYHTYWVMTFGAP